MIKIPGVILESGHRENIDTTKYWIYILMSFIPFLVGMSALWWFK